MNCSKARLRKGAIHVRLDHQKKCQLLKEKEPVIPISELINATKLEAF